MTQSRDEVFQMLVSAQKLALLIASLAAAPRAAAQCLTHIIVPADAEIGDHFGSALAFEGDLIVSRTTGHGVPYEGAGAVYIFQRLDGDWFQVARLGPTPPAIGFGDSVGLSLATLAAASEWSAPVELWSDCPPLGWTQIGTLLPDDTFPEARFGQPLALDEGRLLAGATGDDDGGFSAGAAYVFERDPSGAWLQTAKLLASDADGRDDFGYAVDIDGDVAVVGAHWDEEAGMAAGSAYVFERDASGTWSQTAKLLGHDTDQHDQFGSAVAVDGGRIVIGAFAAASAQTSGGLAYVFERDDDGIWTETARLVPIDNRNSQWFGKAVAVQADRIVVGAPADKALDIGSGAVYVFDRQPDGAWLQTAKLLASDGFYYDNFGTSVAIGGDTVVIGAPQPGPSISYGPGKVYVFDLTGPDCNENSWCDQLDIAEDRSSDVNNNGVPDECEADCNANGLPDDWELAREWLTDCDADGYPDQCALAVFGYVSPRFASFDVDRPARNVIPAPPPAAGVVEFWFEARGDLGQTNEWVWLNVNGVTLGQLFLSADDCAETASIAQLAVSAGAFNAAVLARDADVELVPSESVSRCAGSFIRYRVTYTCGQLDCNHNDVVDTCDIADGTLHDADGDGRPDECPPAPCFADLDGDRWIATSDLLALLSHFGLPSGMQYSEGDLDADADVDLADLSALLERYGTACP